MHNNKQSITLNIKAAHHFLIEWNFVLKNLAFELIMIRLNNITKFKFSNLLIFNNVLQSMLI